jgi:hypothetical protein
MLPKSSLLRAGIVFTALVAGLAGMACSGALQGDKPQARINLEGNYTCVGRNADGGQYQGVVRITKQGDAWYLLWQIGAAGEERHEGLGLVTGETLAVSWRVGTEGGIVVYTIKRTGDAVRLEGKWSAFGSDGAVLDETLTKR